MQSDSREVEDEQHYSHWLIFNNLNINIVLIKSSAFVWETSTESTTADPQLNQIYCSANLSLSQFKSPLILPFPLPPHPLFRFSRRSTPQVSLLWYGIGCCCPCQTSPRGRQWPWPCGASPVSSSLPPPPSGSQPCILT